MRFGVALLLLYFLSKSWASYFSTISNSAYRAFSFFSSLSSKAELLQSTIDLGTLTCSNQVREYIVYKMRVAQAREFLGDTFADCFANYLQVDYQATHLQPHPALAIELGADAAPNTARPGYEATVRTMSWIGSYISHPFSNIDILPTSLRSLIKTVSTLGAPQTIIAYLVRPTTASISSYLPSPLNSYAEGILRGESGKWALQSFMSVASSYILAPSWTLLLVLLSFKYLLMNPSVVIFLTKETFHIIQRCTREEIQLAAYYMIHPKVPGRVLGQLVMENRSKFDDAWAVQALALMVAFPIEAFIDYYSILIVHFPTILTTTSQGLTRNFNWFSSKPHDIILGMSDIIHVFREPSNPKWVLALLESMKKRESFNEAGFLAVEYYLAHLGIIEKLEDWTLEHDDSFISACKLISTIFVPSVQGMKHILRRGYYGLASLMAHYRPRSIPESAFPKYSMISYANEYGTPSVLLALLRHLHLPWRKISTLHLRSKRNLGMQLVFDAYEHLREKGPLSRHVCARTRTIKEGGVIHINRISLDLAFLRARGNEELNDADRLVLARVLAILLFQVSPYVAAEVKESDGTLLADVNKILAHHCGFYEEPRILVAPPKQKASTPKTPKTPKPSSTSAKQAAPRITDERHRHGLIDKPKIMTSTKEGSETTPRGRLLKANF